MRLKIQFGEACNIECIMCWQDYDSKEVLDFNRAKNHIDLTHFESIEIQGGEPLFIKETKNFFDHVAEQGKKVSFLTNGLPITEKIALHSSFVYFSLNAATKEKHEIVNKGSNWE